MKIIFLTLIIFLAALPLQAQIDSVKIEAAIHKADSIRQRKLSLLDSAEGKFTNAAEKVNGINNRLTAYDTLGKKAQALQAALDQKKSKLTSTIDSLKLKGLPYEKYSAKLDSLSRIKPLQGLPNVQGKADEAQQKISGAQNKINEGQSKMQKLQNEPQQKVNEKLALLSKESQGKGALPADLNLANKLPDTKLPDTGLDVQTPALPDIEKPALDVEKNPLDKSIDSKLKMPDMDKPRELDKVGEVQDKVSDEVGDVREKVSGYGDDAKNISTGNVDEVKTLKENAMKKASLDEEVTVLKEGDKAMEEQKAMLKKYKNQEAYKKQVLSRGKEMAMKQMAAIEPQLKQAVEKVSKYQQKTGTILNSSKGLPKRRDPLRKLKYYEKLVPGLTLQMQKSGAVLLDINPSLRYRLTSYWSAGTGWNERVIFGDSPSPSAQTRLYGVRTFTEVIIFKGIGMRLDMERMNAFIKPDDQLTNEGSRQWKNVYMAGLKKEFTFLPRVIGNVQFMYNLSYQNHDRIYPARLNIRFGFEFPLKKKH